MALKEDLQIIRDHFLRTICFVTCETLLGLFFEWNPAHISKEVVASILSIDGWFILATTLLFTVTCLVLLLRSSFREIFRPVRVKSQE
jgi:hypothetical protein